MFTLVTYDVTEDRLRRRVARVLGGYGRRVQYSVFECHLGPRPFAALRRRLAALLRDAAPADSIRLYRLCARCQTRATVLGAGAVSEDPAYFLA